MTSVKEFRVESAATRTDLGAGRFVFTDDYSVFDWGRMPDEIPGKGRSLCTMGAFNFELLEEAGVPTHYRGVVDAGGAVGDDGDDSAGAVVPLADADDPPREMAIELTQVPDLPHTGDGYDYDAYHAAAGDNYLVPLEVVFRNAVPVGSSLRGRVEPREVGLDRDDWPDEPVSLPEPVVEFSTKYEEQDRYLSVDEADRVAGAADVGDLRDLAHRANDLVTERAAEPGFTHEDGKIECLYHRGELKVADVVGTFDENRFGYDDQEVSKEVVRQYYRRTDPDWVAAVAEAKAAAREADDPDWRARCAVDPDPLPADVLAAVTDMYVAGANAYTGRAWFDAPPIDEAVDAVRDL